MSLKFLKKINGDKNGHFKVLIDSFTKKSICPNISWNCNAKNDFRNLFYLSKSYIQKNVLNEEGVNWEEPDLHIYTDNEYFDELFPSKTTAYYIKKKLIDLKVKVSTIARGIPIGGDLEYTDEITLGRSILSRIDF